MMKILACAMYIAVLIAELHALECIGVTPGTRYWWVVMLGYLAAAFYGVLIGGK